MFLVVDAPAVPVQGPVQSMLLTLGQVTAMLGFIDALALRDVRVVLFVVCGLLIGHSAVGDTLIDARLLVIEPLIDLVDPRVIGHVLSEGQRRAQDEAKSAGGDKRDTLNFHKCHPVKVLMRMAPAVSFVRACSKPTAHQNVKMLQALTRDTSR
jgi:hypothetical protein